MYCDTACTFSNVIDLQAETRGNTVLPAAGAGGHAHYRSRAGVPIFCTPGWAAVGYVLTAKWTGSLSTRLHSQKLDFYVTEGRSFASAAASTGPLVCVTERLWCFSELVRITGKHWNSKVTQSWIETSFFCQVKICVFVSGLWCKIGFFVGLPKAINVMGTIG